MSNHVQYLDFIRDRYTAYTTLRKHADTNNKLLLQTVHEFAQHAYAQDDNFIATILDILKPAPRYYELLLVRYLTYGCGMSFLSVPLIQEKIDRFISKYSFLTPITVTVHGSDNP